MYQVFSPPLCVMNDNKLPFISTSDYSSIELSNLLLVIRERELRITMLISISQMMVRKRTDRVPKMAAAASKRTT